MSQIIQVKITNRGANLDLLPGGPTDYGFDVDDIVSPIRYNSGLSKSYFTARTNKGGVNDNRNGSKIDYQSSDSLSVIAAQSISFALLTVVSRRGVPANGEQYIFNVKKIMESLVPVVNGTKFYYTEDGDVLPVEYIVEEPISDIISQTAQLTPSQVLAITGKGVFGKVANYSALPDPALHDGETWIALAKQGTSWLPGPLLGTYYPRGQYYSDGTNWIYDETPYQASQSDVNAGLIQDQFVSPKTLNDCSQLASKASLSGSETLTNKRITQRVTTIVSSATPTINTDNCDAVNITDLATAITSMTTNLSGTPTNFQKLIIRIKDNGTARAITWGASFASRGATLPTTTVLGKITTVGLIYNTTTSVWGCVAVAQEV